MQGSASKLRAGIGQCSTEKSFLPCTACIILHSALACPSFQSRSPNFAFSGHPGFSKIPKLCLCLFWLSSKFKLLWLILASAACQVFNIQLHLPAFCLYQQKFFHTSCLDVRLMRLYKEPLWSSFDGWCVHTMELIMALFFSITILFHNFANQLISLTIHVNLANHL